MVSVKESISREDNQGRKDSVHMLVALSFGFVAQLGVKKRNEKASLASAFSFMFPPGCHGMSCSRLLYPFCDGRVTPLDPQSMVC